jgi:hypothetical protein
MGIGSLPPGAFEGLLAQPVTGGDEPWIRVVVDSAASRLLAAGQEETAGEGSDAALSLSVLQGLFQSSLTQRVVVERRGDDLVVVSNMQASPQAAPKP